MQLLDDIAAGRLDDFIFDLRDWVNSRIDELGFEIGDRVKIHNCSPAYLIGATGTVKSTEGTRIGVTLDRSHGRFRVEHAVACKPSMLKLESRPPKKETLAA